MNEEKLHRYLELLGWGAVIVVLVCILNSCGVCKNCEYRTPVTDSIYIERIDSVFIKDTILKVQMRDSLVYAVADSASHLETDVALSDAWIEEGKLHHRLENKRDLVPIKVAVPKAISTEKHYIRQVVVQKVNELTQMQSFWMVLGKIFACICIVIIIIQGVRRWIVR